MSYVKQYPPSLSLTLKPSQGLTQLLIVIHVLALIASVSNTLPIMVRLVIFSGVALHLYRTKHRTEQPPYTIQHSQELGWQINRAGDEQNVQILPSTVITTFIIFLHFSVNGQRRTLLIANDTLNTDEYRRLIVELKTSTNNKRL